MDFIAHILWSLIIFSGPQVYFAIVAGAIPDFIPFGAYTVVKLAKALSKSGKTNTKSKVTRFGPPRELWADYESTWVYRAYNYTHSLPVWAFLMGILIFVGYFFNFFPWFMFAWLIHIAIDIPTHTKQFFAPKFLTPFSEYRVDGVSWAHPVIMVTNYLGIGVTLFFRLRQYQLV